MTQNKPVKAIVAIIKIGEREIEGLKFPDETYGIAIPQIQKLFDDFLTSTNIASRDINRLMGKDFKTSKAKTEFNKNVTKKVLNRKKASKKLVA